ncbi:unnamed protein product [Absidia cylindrospora]
MGQQDGTSTTAANTMDKDTTRWKKMERSTVVKSGLSAEQWIISLTKMMSTCVHDIKSHGLMLSSAYGLKMEVLSH